ncbi:sensor histidine kinase [Microlunatus flavus]|uniref:histidine kinase n=1 Tax=Microlunatus flavus TaxID=1036181 RepID=A0A1H9DES6_9ACTN|nr:HAMP domain-containing sensor histidine kinase [Microlunatus flavus]SEQ11889.1 two-component system, OmpR family, sensor histidine kinase MprB [Microlunatus flavus]
MDGVWSTLRRNPLQRRVTVLTVALVALAVVASNLAGYVALRVTLLNASESVALRVAADLVEPAARSLTTTDQLSLQLRQAGGVVVEAVDAQGRVVRVPGETATLVLAPRDLAATGPDGVTVRRSGVDTAGRPYVVVVVPVPTTGDGLVVARPLATALQVLSAARVISGLVVLASLLAATVAGSLVARSALRPVRELTGAVQRAADTRDFQSVPVREARGEVAVLAASFNQLLRSITTMRERQSRLVADAGQELRAPLASLTENVDLLTRDLGSPCLTPEARAAVLGEVRARLQELTRLVGDLVHLTRGDGAEAFVPLDLRVVVRAAVDRVRPKAPHHAFDLRLHELHVIGDADALERAVVHLLDNAVTWSPAGSTVRVRLDGNRLRVADSGPGIAEAELPYVFDRFFRGRAARRRPGSGLGLSVVAKTVEDHGGSVRAGRSDDGGAELTVQLPGVTRVEALPRLLTSAT